MKDDGAPTDQEIRERRRAEHLRYERAIAALEEIASGLSTRNPFDIANEALKK